MDDERQNPFLDPSRSRATAEEQDHSVDADDKSGPHQHPPPAKHNKFCTMPLPAQRKLKIDERLARQTAKFSQPAEPTRSSPEAIEEIPLRASSRSRIGQIARKIPESQP